MPTAAGEVEIAGRVYGLVERVEGNHYEVSLQKDADTIYTVHCHHGAWQCSCPAQKFRNRETAPCKHIQEMRRRREHQETPIMPATTEAPTRDAVNEARGLTRPALQQVTSVPTSGPLAAASSSQSGRTQLCIALAKAQSAIGRIPHDAKVEFGKVKYDYTSSEAIIDGAKKALGDNGLALLPLEETLNGHEREGINRYELECKFILMHQSGEVQPLLRHWPVCIGDGRPLDKATAAASTLCLAYLLRDLLLIPRVNPVDDVNQRDDTPPQQRPARPVKPQKPAKAPVPTSGKELVVWLRNLDNWGVERALWDKGGLISRAKTIGEAEGFPADMGTWSPDQVSICVEIARRIAKRESARAKEAAPIPEKSQAGAA